MADLPEKIGKYDITGVAGKGAMGVVYVGHDPFVDRKVAIKVNVNPDEAGTTSANQARKLFFNEAQSAGALDHPNILKVYDAGDADGQAYIAMEFVEQADTLKSFCSPNKLLPIETVLQHLVKCAEALDYAHQRSITHRDIKPANIMLNRNGDVKIGDFGIAQRGNTDQTQVLGWFGSPMYMSPEQASDQSTTSQTDLFSLGVVMYELLAGKHPFAAKGLSGLLNNILNKDPQPIREIRPDIPAQLEAVVKRALQKELAKRYQTGAEMAADLSKVVAELQNPELQISEEEKFSLARELKFFQDFSDSEVAEVIAASDWARYWTGTRLIEQGDAERAFYIIVSGSASVEQHGAGIATLSQGECFGEMGYLSGSERTASVVVSEVMTVMRIDMPFNEWASLPCQLRLNKAFQRILIERLATTSKSLTAKVTAALPRDSSFEQTMLLQAGAP